MIWVGSDLQGEMSWIGEALCSVQVTVDAVANASGRCLHGDPGEVCVPAGCLHLCVTKQFSNHRQAFAESQGPGGKVWRRS